MAKLDFGGYANQELFDAFAAADSEPDPADRVSLYEDLNVQIMDFLPGGPDLALAAGAGGRPDGVEGLVPSPLTSEDFSTVTLTQVAQRS
ncbi:MAG: hypothetical protein WKF47_02920 [Geodermatophilaceae bacterium]